MADGGGGLRWQDEVEPELRPRMFQRTVATIDGLFREQEESTPETLHEDVANVEMDTFMRAEDKMAYMRKMALGVYRCQNTQAQPQAAEPHQQQMQMTMHQVQINANQGPSDMMPMLCQTFNSQPAMVAPVAQGASQQIIQPIGTVQSHNQYPVMQLQPTDVTGCHPFNMAQLQGQPIAQPNGQQNYLLSQNVCSYGPHLQPTVQQQYFGINQQQVGMQRYQKLGANVVRMNDGYSGGWNNQSNVVCLSGIQSPLKASEQVALKRHINMESQSMTPTQRQITINQQSNVHCPSPQSQAKMANAGEVDWREEMAQQIKPLKDVYFSELVELDQNTVVQSITEEQLKSLPREEADNYKNMLTLKNCISSLLKFLQLEQSPETYRRQLHRYGEFIPRLLSWQRTRKADARMNTEHESKSYPSQPPPETINLTADIFPLPGGKSNQQKLPADETIGQMRQNVVSGQMRQNVVTTPSAQKKTHSKQMQGLTSPCFSIKSPGALQSPPINDNGLSCMPSPVDKSRVALPNSLLKSRSQSPIANPEVPAVSSPCLSAKSTLTSTVEKLGSVAAASPCSSVKSSSPSAIAKLGILPVASPSNSDSSFLRHNNAAVNGCNRITPTKLLTPDPPYQTQAPAGQSEDKEQAGAEAPVDKKPIDRLIAAVLSSSPGVLRSSVNLIESALRGMDSVPLMIQPNNKMKRVYDVTSPPLDSTDVSTLTFEFDASDSASNCNCSIKRQKTQNTNDTLQAEIEDVNSKLIDTVISIASDDREDGITSCNSVTLVKLSYTAVSLAPGLKSLLATLGNIQPLVMPMTLLIPADYPRSSPVIMDDEGDGQLRANFSCISVVVDAAFRLALHNLQEPRSLKETAIAWDSCVRHAIMKYACLLGGGALSSSIDLVRVESAHEKRGILHEHGSRSILCG
ncbi:unnamed protein product [Urochloa humidicola]